MAVQVPHRAPGPTRKPPSAAHITPIKRPTPLQQQRQQRQQHLTHPLKKPNPSTSPPMPLITTPTQNKMRSQSSRSAVSGLSRTTEGGESSASQSTRHMNRSSSRKTLPTVSLLDSCSPPGTPQQSMLPQPKSRSSAVGISRHLGSTSCSPTSLVSKILPRRTDHLHPPSTFSPSTTHKPLAQHQKHHGGVGRNQLPAPPPKLNYCKFADKDIKVACSSAYPEEYVVNGYICVCEGCLGYAGSEFQLKRHKAKCSCKYPPGQMIYAKDTARVYEVDGRREKLYCQYLCLLGKLWLEHKVLCFDVESFLFYVLTINHQFIGYFSKDKTSARNNLSCIVTLPVYQGNGYGTFLIKFSYLLSRREGRTGTAERPFSSSGKVAYDRYWMRELCRVAKEVGPRGLRVRMLEERTGICREDIWDTLQGHGCLSKRLRPATSYSADSSVPAISGELQHQRHQNQHHHHPNRIDHDSGDQRQSPSPPKQRRSSPPTEPLPDSIEKQKWELNVTHNVVIPDRFMREYSRFEKETGKLELDESRLRWKPNFFSSSPIEDCSDAQVRDEEDDLSGCDDEREVETCGPQARRRLVRGNGRIIMQSNGRRLKRRLRYDEKGSEQEDDQGECDGAGPEIWPATKRRRVTQPPQTPRRAQGHHYPSDPHFNRHTTGGRVTRTRTGSSSSLSLFTPPPQASNFNAPSLNSTLAFRRGEHLSPPPLPGNSSATAVERQNLRQRPGGGFDGPFHASLPPSSSSSPSTPAHAHRVRDSALEPSQSPTRWLRRRRHSNDAAAPQHSSTRTALGAAGRRLGGRSHRHKSPSPPPMLRRRNGLPVPPSGRRRACVITPSSAVVTGPGLITPAVAPESATQAVISTSGSKRNRIESSSGSSCSDVDNAEAADAAGRHCRKRRMVRGTAGEANTTTTRREVT